MKKMTWIAVLAAMVLPLGAFADQHEEAEQPAPLTDVWMIVPKAGMDAKFTEAAKKHMAFRAKAGESRTWMAFRPVIGKKLNIVHFRACCFDYADQDAYMVESEKLGLAADWNKNVDPYVDHYHHYLEKTTGRTATGRKAQMGRTMARRRGTGKKARARGPAKCARNSARSPRTRAGVRLAMATTGSGWNA